MTHDEATAAGPSQAQDELYPGRRQLATLSVDDLARAGVWWFPGPDGHLSGPDDQTVMPMDTSAATESGDAEFPAGRFLLSAVFTLADGSSVTGHITYAPGDGGSPRDREPTICTQRGQIPLWHGVLVPAKDEAATWLSWLCRAEDAVFPLTWRAAFHPPGDALAGAAEGFLVLAGGEVRALTAGLKEQLTER